MTKNRLPDLLRNYSSFANSLSDSLNNGYDETILNVGNSSIEELLKEYEDIIPSINSIKANLDMMTQMLQTTNLRNVNEDEMEKLRNQNLKTGQYLMTKFQSLKTNLPNDDDYTIEARMNRSLFYGLHQSYINLWTKNELFLQSYETKLKKNIQLHAKILNCNPTEEEVEELIANKQKSLFVDNILEETEKERRTLRGLMQRHAELLRLEKSIEDVHFLFLRIQNLVMEQSERIQIVEYHAQQASMRVDKGNEELDKARELKEKTNKMKMILILIIVIVVLLFIITTFVT